MRNFLRAALVGSVLFVLAQSIVAQNVQYRVELLADHQTYRVVMRPTVSWVFPNNNTLGAQVTLLARTGTLTVTNLVNLNGAWTTVPTIVAPSENPDYDYLVFYLSSSVQLPFSAGVETPLFTFKRGGGACTTGQVGIINNFIDPFMEPNSQSLNVGNYIATQGGGGSSNNLWNGNYSAGSANCKGDCQVEYHLDKIAAGKYQVSMTPFVNWPSPQNVTATQQVAIKVPTGNFVVSNLTNLVTGATYVLGSRTNHPPESPDFDYLLFNLQGSSTALTYQSGVNLPLFTFENTGACAPGKIWLVDNASDPFMPPNTSSINTGQQLTTLGYGQPDVPICIAGTGAADCSVFASCPPLSGSLLGPDRTICQGQNTQLQVTGTFAFYTWAPSTGLSCSNCANPTANPASTTSYILTVKDVNNCTYKDTIILNITPLPVFTNVSVTPAGCSQNTGSISIAATGTGTLEYTINNGNTWQTSNTFNALAAGTYQVQVRKQGTTCTANYAQNPITIGSASAPIILQVQSNDPSDCSLNNGTISIAASGANLQFSVTGGSTWLTSNYFAGLATGNYPIAVRNSADNCITNGNTVTLAGPVAPIINSVTPVAATDCGLPNGSVTINAVVGQGYPQGAPLEYSINNGAFWQASNFFNGLAPGTHIAYVRNANNTCAVFSAPVVVGTPIAPNITGVVATQASACGQNDGNITITATVGQGYPQGAPLQYSINGTAWQTGNVFSSLSPGTYTVFVRNQNNACPTAFAGNPVVINAPQGPAIVSVAAVNPTDCGQTSNGSITITATSPGAGNLEYSINGGTAWQGANAFTGLGAGVYNPRVRLVGGTCPNTFPALTLTQPVSATIISFTKNDISDCGANDGAITITATSGLSPLEYSINGTFWQTNSTFSQLSPGTYTLRVRNYNGTCVYTHPAQAVINGIASPSITNLTKTEPACGINNGTATITAGSGAGPLEYSMDGFNWQTGNAFVNLAPGTYNAFVRNADNTCATPWANNPVQMSLSPSPQIALVTVTNPSDCGGNDGSINIAANSTPLANQPLQYSINGGAAWQATGFFQNLSPGMYAIVVRNTTGTPCSVIYPPVTITGKTAPTLVSATGTNPSNCGLDNGSVAITAFGGQMPLEYSIDGINWQTGNVFGQAQGLPAGSYLARVRNADNSCPQTAVAPTVLTAPTAISQSAISTSPINPTACGTANGSITVNIAGGTAGLQFSLNGYNWQASNLFTSLSAGSYLVSVRKFDGTCVQSAIAPTVLNAGQGPLFVTIQTQDPQGCGVNNGGITLNVTGNNLEYSINNGVSFQTSNIFSNLSSGTYQLVARVVGSACTSTANTVLTNPVQPIITASTATPITDCGATNGSITITATTGQGYPQGAPLQYSINNGLSWQASSIFTGLSAAAYTVAVRNANGGCTVTGSSAITITAPISPFVTAASGISPTACGTNNGSITITAAGGQAPLEYTVNNLNWSTSNVFSDLGPGSYQVWVRNADNSCVTAFPGNPITLLPGQGPSITNVQGVSPTDCTNPVNGSINITATAPAQGAPLQYSINGGASFQTSNGFSMLGAGSYQIVVRVGTSTCTATSGMTLTAPVPPTIVNTTAVASTDCGAANGSINITATGATQGASLQYSINNGATWQANGSFTGLGAGSYTVSVRNANGGCTVTAAGAIVVPAPATPGITSVNASSPSNCGINNGTINISATGGQSPLEYTIDNSTWVTGNVFNNLAAGTYQIWVRNANNSCPVPYVGNPVVLGNGQIPVILSVQTQNPQGCGVQDGSITVNVMGNNLEYSINGGTNFQTSNVFVGLGTGFYPIVVRQGTSSCSALSSATLNAPAAPSITGVVPVATTDCGANNGSITITASTPSGTGALQYSNDGGQSWQTSNVFGALSPGIYPVSVRNANGGCAIAWPSAVTVTAPIAPIISAAAGTSPSSCGASNGSITVTATVGQGYPQGLPLQYSIDNITWASSNVFNNLGAGSYFVRVRNSNNSCSVSFAGNPIVLNTGQGPSITNITANNPTDCSNPNNGSISIAATGNNLEYSINNGATYQTSNVFENLSVGIFLIVVRQNNQSCIAASTVSLNAPIAPVILGATATSIGDCNSTDGSITITAVAGQGQAQGLPLQYSNNGTVWQTSNVFNGLNAGAYSVFVRNGTGACMVSGGSVNVLAPVAPVIVSVNGISPNACGINNGSITVTATVGQGHPQGAPLQYSLDNQVWSNSNVFNNLAPGQYQVWVRNANGSCAVVAVSPTVLNAGQGPVILASGIENPEGCGIQDGTITVNALGNNLQYSINNGSTFQASNIFTALAAGVYPIVVRQNNQAACSAASTATLLEPSAASISSVVPVAAGCNNATGSITVTATGGLTPLQYWINGAAAWQVSNVFNGLAAGIYTVSVRNADGGCSVTAMPVAVSAQAVPTIISVGSSSPTVCGTNNGTISITATGQAQGSLQYSIDNQNWVNSNVFNGLAAGVYQVWVRNANGACAVAYSANPIVLDAGQGPSIISTQAQNTQGCGSNTGSITITATTPSGSLQYSIDNGATFQNSGIFSGLAAATYQVIVRQGVGSCTASATVTVAAPNVPTLVEYHLDEISTGKYQVSMTSFVNWPAPQNLTSTQQIAVKVPTGNFIVANLTNLVGGANYVLGSRSNHPSEDPASDYLHFNLQNANSALTYQNGLNVPLFTFENVGTCNGGTIRLVDNASDPFLPPNSASINTGQQLTTLGYGQPDVPICLGGSGMAACGVAPCAAPVGGLLGADRSICQGLGTQLDVMGLPQGATVQYAWSPTTGLSCTNCANPVANPAITTQYILSVTTGNSCVFKDTITVNVGVAPSITSTQTADPQGCGVNNGSITVQATGSNLEYSINNGLSFQSSSTFTGLAAGTYLLVVKTLGQSCSANGTAILTEPLAPTITGIATTATDCKISSGTITVTATAGQAQGLPLQYSINNGISWQNGNVFTGLPAATYTVSVRNANGGCTVTALPVMVGTPPLPNILSVSLGNPQGCGTDNGSIAITALPASGLPVALEYSINNGSTFQATNTFNGLAAGVYLVAVREAGFTCLATLTVTLTAPVAPTLSNIESTQTDCNNPTGTITITATTGQGYPQGAPLQYSVNGTVWQNSAVFTGLAAGDYTVSVRNANGGCTQSAATPTTITAPLQASITAAVGIAPSACSANDGSITITATGGQGPLQYSIDNQNWVNSGVFSNLMPGSYHVFVRNGDGACAVAFSGNPILLDSGQEPVITGVQALDPSNCANPNNGSLIITATGTDLQYSINNGASFQSSNTFNGLTAGNYQVIVRQQSAPACSAMTSAILALPNAPIITGTVSSISLCNDATGSITVNANAPSGQAGGLEYSLNGGVWQNSPIFTGLAPGSYTVRVRGVNGFCVVSTAALIIGSFDDQAPTVVCPADVTVTAGQGQTAIAVTNLSAPVVNDNCTASPMLIYVRTGATMGIGTGAANGSYNVGTTIVHYTAADAAGNTATCVFSVTVNNFMVSRPLLLKADTIVSPCDVAGQVIEVPVRVTDFTDIALLRFNVQWDPAVLSLVQPPFDLIDNNNLGLQTSPAFYTDTLIGQLHFSGIAANPAGWPDLAPESVFCTLRFIYKDPTQVSAIAFQNLPNFPIMANQAGTFSTVPVSTQPGQTRSTPDITAPVLNSCPANVTVSAATNACDAAITLTAPTATDNCALASTAIVSSHPGNIFDIGATTVVYTAADHNGNTATCSTKVTVNGTGAFGPQFANCPNNVTLNLLNGPCEGTATWAPPTPFNHCSSGSLAVSSSHSPGQIFQFGITNVLYTVTDTAGNFSQCAFTVTLRDLTPPVAQNCPDPAFPQGHPQGAPLLVPNTSNCFALANWAVPTFADNCSASIQILATHALGDTLPIGITEVSYTATDASGNVATCTFNVLVTDNTPPSLANCPGTVTVAANTFASSAGCGAIASWTEPTLVSACSTIGNTLSSDHAAGQFFPLGVTTVTYFAANAYGVKDSCSFTVIVKDETPPTFGAFPADIVIELAANQCDTLLNWASPQTDDLCGVDSLYSDLQSGAVLAIGSHIITYTAVDGSGNSSTRSFTVLVRDLVAPVIGNCPANVTVSAPVNACEAAVNWPAVTATDNCDAAVSITSNIVAGQLFPSGATLVRILAQDDGGNADTCSFTVTVTGGGTPALTNCPDNQLFNACNAVATWVAPTAAGFCETPIIVADFVSGTVFTPGTTTITYTATAANGSTATCSFYINVRELVAPTIICPAAVEVDLAGRILSDPSGFLTSADTVTGCSSVEIAFGGVVATDNCGTANVVQNAGPNTGDALQIGDNTVSFVATDEAGNTAGCAVVIKVRSVKENLNPSANISLGCTGDGVLLSVNDIAGASYIWGGPQAPYANAPNLGFDLDGNTAGVYTVSALINGCVSLPDTLSIRLAETPIAINDSLEIAPRTSEEINLLANDLGIIPGDAVATLVAPLAGFELLDDGVLYFEGSETPGSTHILLYDLCSKACPDKCSRAKIVVTIKDNGCSFIPNIISPNEDGTNDGFIIPCIDRSQDQMPDNLLVIYNQWGDRVYEAQPYINDELHAWKGTLYGEEGKYLPDGVYYYLFQPSIKKKKVLRGFLEIYR